MTLLRRHLLPARHADRLADALADRERVRAGTVDSAFIDDGSALNDARRGDR